MRTRRPAPEGAVDAVKSTTFVEVLTTVFT